MTVSELVLTNPLVKVSVSLMVVLTVDERFIPALLFIVSLPRVSPFVPAMFWALDPFMVILRPLVLMPLVLLLVIEPLTDKSEYKSNVGLFTL